MNKMQIMSVSQIVEQLFKSVLTICFVLAAAGKAAEIMSAYANLATTAATVFGTAYLIFEFKRGNSGGKTAAKFGGSSDFAGLAKKILAIAIPVSICSVISAINRIVDTATITRGIEKAFELCIPPHIGAAAVMLVVPAAMIFMGVSLLTVFVPILIAGAVFLAAAPILISKGANGYEQI